MESGRACNLMIHNSSSNVEEVILNADLFGDLTPGSLIRITSLENTAVNVIVRLQPNTHASSGQMEVSLLKSVADAIGFKPFNRVVLQSVTEEEAQVDFVELSFRKQFVRRGDVLRFKFAMVNRSIYQNQSLTVDSMQASIQDIRKSSSAITSGVISTSTKFVFRSKSARIVWLVQISAEMWDMDPNGDMFFDKFVRDFAQPVLNKWKALGVSHMLTICFFARTLYLDEKINQASHADSLLKKSLVFQDGLYMQDHLKIVVENVADIDKKIGEIISKLRSELWTFAKDCGWRIPVNNNNANIDTTTGTANSNFKNSTLPSTASLEDLAEAATRPRSTSNRTGSNIACAVPSDATHGNLLEATNIVLNLLDKHYLDRDLQRTGNSIVVITAGTGLFKVRPKIAMITKQRMLDNAIGIDCISLSRPPIHTVPLFFVDAKALHNNAKNFYEVPHWMKVSYLDCQRDHDNAMHLLNNRPALSESQVISIINKGWDAQWTKQILPHAYSSFLSSQLGYYTCLGIGGNKEVHVKATEAMIVLRETYAALLPFALRSYLIMLMSTAVAASPSATAGTTTNIPIVFSLPTNINTDNLYWGQAEVNFEQLNEALGDAAVELHQRSTVWQREVTTNLRRLAKSPSTNHPTTNEMMLPDVFESLPQLRHEESQNLATSYGSNAGGDHDLNGSQPSRSLDTSSHFGAGSSYNSHGGQHMSLTREGRISDERIGNHPFPLATNRSLSNNTSNYYLHGYHRRGMYENILTRKQLLHELSFEKEALLDHERIQEIAKAYDLAASDCCRPHHALPPSTVDLHAEDMTNASTSTDEKEHERSKTEDNKVISAEKRRQTSIDVDDDDRTTFPSRQPSVTSSHSTVTTKANQPLVGVLKNSNSRSSLQSLSSAISLPPATTLNNKKVDVGIASTGKSEIVQPVQKEAVAASLSAMDGKASELQNDTLSMTSGSTTTSAAASSSMATSSASPATKITAPKDPRAARLLNAAMNKSKMRKHVVQSLAAHGLMQPPTQAAIAPSAGGISSINNKIPNAKEAGGKLSEKEQELEDLIAYERRNSINPFRQNDGQKYLEMVTHNRRRWAHVFAQGRHHLRVDYSLNWKSLTQPAILPLNTDYLPSLSDLKARFTCDHYQFLFDDKECPFASMEAALLEMVCTRLSHEYQLYQQNFDKDAYLRAASRYDAISSSKESLLFYVLTMGHRIHFIVGDTIAKKVFVTQYISTKGRNEEERKEGTTDTDRTRVQCKYEIWSPQVERFLTMTQTFALFPDEFLWNQLDTLILGTMPYDGVATGKKPRTLKYTIIPPLIRTEEEMDAHYNKIDLLFEFLKKYIPQADVNNNDMFPILKDRTILNMNAEGSGGEIQSKLAVLYYRQTAKETDNNLAVIRLMLHGYKQSNPNWVYIKHDRNIYSFKAFHLNLEWFACDSWSLDKFINELYRKCRQWGLRLVQTPSYFGSHDLNVHPLRPLIHMVVPMPSFTIPQQHCSPSRLIERLLFSNTAFNNGEWVFDAERNTDWFTIGLSFPNYTERDRDIIQEETLVNAVKTAAQQQQQSSSQVTASATSSSSSTGSTSVGLGSLSEALRKLFPLLRGRSNNTNADSQMVEEAVTSYASPVGALSSQSGSFSSQNNNNPGASGTQLGRAMLKRFDRQYVHHMGIATVRMTANGFIFLSSAAARVSDITMPLEEKVDLTKRVQRQLEERMSIIVNIYELLIGDVFDQALILVEQREQTRVESIIADFVFAEAFDICTSFLNELMLAEQTKKEEELEVAVEEHHLLPVAEAEIVDVDDESSLAVQTTAAIVIDVPSASSTSGEDTKTSATAVSDTFSPL